MRTMPTQQHATDESRGGERAEIFVGHELREAVVRVAETARQLGALRGGDQVATAGERSRSGDDRPAPPRTDVDDRETVELAAPQMIHRPQHRKTAVRKTGMYRTRALFRGELERRNAQEVGEPVEEATAVGDDAFVGEHRDVLGSEAVLVLAYERVVLVVREIEVGRLPLIVRPERGDAARIALADELPVLRFDHVDLAAHDHEHPRLGKRRVQALRDPERVVSTARRVARESFCRHDDDVVGAE